MTLAVLKLSGILPVSFMLLYNIINGSVIMSHASAKTVILIPSGPGAELLLVFLMAFLISSLVIFIWFNALYGGEKYPTVPRGLFLRLLPFHMFAFLAAS